METLELVQAVSPKIGDLGGSFYFVPETQARGKELGLDGFRFYMLGRGGVLGDVEAPVVVSAFGYFAPAAVERIWNSGRERIDPRDAGRAYLECAREHGRRHLADVEDLAGFCAAAEAVVAAAPTPGLSLYAGASAEPLPDDLPGRALQLLVVLRELRGSVHLLAVVANGLEPRIAHYLRRPNDYGTFGYDAEAPPEVTDDHRARHQAAEELTDRLLLPAYSVLDDAGRRALATGVDRIWAAVTG
jgi:hypothetical protein